MEYSGIVKQGSCAPYWDQTGLTGVGLGWPETQKLDTIFVVLCGDNGTWDSLSSLIGPPVVLPPPPPFSMLQNKAQNRGVYG